MILTVQDHCTRMAFLIRSETAYKGFRKLDGMLVFLDLFPVGER